MEASSVASAAQPTLIVTCKPFPRTWQPQLPQVIGQASAAVVPSSSSESQYLDGFLATYEQPFPLLPLYSHVSESSLQSHVPHVTAHASRASQSSPSSLLQYLCGWARGHVLS